MSLIDVGAKKFKMTINGNSIFEYSLVVGVPTMNKGGVSCPANVLNARIQLRKYLALLTGATLPYGSDKNPVIKEYEICVGKTDRDEETFNKQYKEEEFDIKTVGNRLIICGGKRGILYGVYTFLEKFCGVRFLAQDVEKVIDTKEIKINDLNYNYCPDLEYRDLCYWAAFDTEFSVKRKINSTFVRKLPFEWGEGVGWAGGGLVHTIPLLLSYDKYYKDHPEYFALRGDGIRATEGICFASEGAYQAILSEAKEWMKRSGESDILSVSIGDGSEEVGMMTYCHCPHCQKIREEEGSESGEMLRLVNRLADDLKVDYPNIKVEMLVYGKIVHAPKITKPRDNVVVRICPWSLRSHSFEDYYTTPMLQENPSMQNSIAMFDEWGKFCKKVYIWEYPATYAEINTIFPCFHTLFPNARFYREHNVKGVFVNGNAETTQFNDMIVYLLSKLYFDPPYTEEEFTAMWNEFLEGYYGKGWKYIREYLDYTKEMATKDGHTFGTGVDATTIFPGEYPNPVILKKMKYLFDKAIKTSKTQAEKWRIERDSTQVDIYEFYNASEREFHTADEKRKKELYEGNKKIWEKLRKFGIARIGERTFVPGFVDFNQASHQWTWWDGEAERTGWADRNNERTRRDMYGILKTQLPVGTKVDVTFTVISNNTNKDAYFSLFGGDKFSYYMKDGKKAGFTYDDTREYMTVTIKDCVVSKLEDYVKLDGHDMNYSNGFLGGYQLIKPHFVGVILKAEQMDGGAYLYIKNPEFKVKD